MHFIKILMYIFVLLSFLPASVLSIDLGPFQLSIFRVLLIILPVLISLDKFNNGSKQFRHIKNEFLSYPTLFSIIWFVYSLLSYFWAKDLFAWMKANYFIGLGLFSVIMMQLYLKDIKSFKIIFKIISLVIAINIVIGSTEIITQRYLFLNSERVVKYARNRYPVSWYKNTNDFATLMLLGFNITFACISIAKGKIRKLYYTAISTLSVTLLLLTGSRANELGLLISILIIATILFRFERKRIMVLCSIIVASYILIGILQYAEIIADNRLGLSFSIEVKDFETYQADTIVSDIIPESSDSIRVNLIKNGILFLKKSYGFGVGAGNIEFWMTHFSVYNTRGIINIHNWWAEILVGYGIFILLGYLIFYGYLFLIPFLNLLHVKKPNDLAVISLAIVAFLGGYTLGSISSSSNISNEGIWVFMAIIVAFLKLLPTSRNLFLPQKYQS